MIRKTDGRTLEQLFDAALVLFPIALTPTARRWDELLHTEADANVLHAREVTFHAGRILEEQLVACGWIIMRSCAPDHSMASVTGTFILSVNGDFVAAGLLPADTAIGADYDCVSHRWRVWVEMF